MMVTDLIRVLVVDDHPIVRRGIRALLTTEAKIEVVGEAADGQEAVREAKRLAPDVVLMDLVMPRMDGVEAIRRIRSEQREVKILVLTSFGSDDKLFPAVKAGALGYIIKDASPEELVRAVHDAAQGHTTLNHAVARRLLQEFSDDRNIPEPLEPLTKREREVLRQLARGLSNDRIADQLYISEATVRTHVSNILTKLNLSNRTQAVLYALREGIASLEDLHS